MSYIGVPPFGNTVRSVTNETATASQTTFNITGGYVPGYVDVFLNGVLLIPGTDFTATDGLTVVLTVAAASGDEFQALAYQTISFTDAYTQTQVDDLLDAKQDTLVSGTSIKTVNSTSLLGSGDVAVQPTLVSGTNIKTLNSESLLGSGDITISVPAAFDSGTVMLFGQTSAPTGWTKDTTNYNNSGLRIVTGSTSTGGSVDFTTAFASQTPSGSVSVDVSGLSAGATTLSTSQMPSHSHVWYTAPDGGALFTTTVGRGDSNSYTMTTSSAGGGGSHSHSMSGSATGSFTGNAINLAVKYVDVIRATKD